MKITQEAGARPIKAWTDDIEESAWKQAQEIARLPFIHKNGVALMPDVHAGIGSTVGTVIATEKAIIPAAVGVDIGCFHGDTKIETLDGKKRKIRDLARRDKPIVVFAFDRSTQKIVVTKATAHKTRADAKLVKVRLDSGEAIICTPDHKFLTRCGRYVEAQELQPSASLMPLYFATDRDGYVGVRQMLKTGRLGSGTGHGCKVHSMVAKAFVPKKATWDEQQLVVHHKNENKNDNRPANLEWVGREDHSTHHYEERLANGTWHFTADNPVFEKKRKAGIRKLAETEEGYRMMANRGRDNMAAVMEDPEAAAEFREKTAGNGKRGRTYLQQYNNSKEGRSKSRAPKNHTCIFCGSAIKSDSFKGYHYKRKHGREVYEYLEARGQKRDTATHYQPNNHKVVSVKKLKLTSDVYCLNVPKYHNFALAAGVFVHNCGLNAVRTSLKASDLPDTLRDLRHQIERDIPLGTGGGHKRKEDIDRNWKNRTHLEAAFHEVAIKSKTIRGEPMLTQLGSLGSGNHFIELCLDENQDVWVMLHSGSRGTGNKIGMHFIEKARREAERWMIQLPNKDLAYLPEGSEHFDRYVAAVDWAQNYALANRAVMMDRVLAALHRHVPKEFILTSEAVNCHHNYVERENHFGSNLWVTRKGAIRAREGDLGIIPGSMGQRSYIVRGKGNAESYCSCSHGAGRRMSRTAARKYFTVEDLKNQTEGVECLKTDSVLDEIPGAYKSLDEVMANQTDLVEVVHTLKAVLCVKGA